VVLEFILVAEAEWVSLVVQESSLQVLVPMALAVEAEAF
jgi:hypothetical protein